MADIKNINGASQPVDNLRAEQTDGALQNGKFQGSNASTVKPPVESPVADRPDGSQLNAKRAEPPVESPVSANQNQTTAGKGYQITDRQADTISPPDGEQLFDHAVGNTKDNGIRKYLEQDPAASRAVAAIRRGHAEIGSPDTEPKLDSSAEARLNDIAKKLFG